MKRLFGFAVLFCGLILAVAVFDAAKGQVNNEEVFEIQYTEEPVVEVIYDVTEMDVKEAKARGVKGLEKRKDTEKVKVKYPKVVFVKDGSLNITTE